MDVRRYLCSELIVLKTAAGECLVNLEEIWSGGGVVEAEIDVEPGVKVELKTGETNFHGSVTKAEAHEFGYRVEVEFSPLTPWSADRFSPKHLLDLSALDRRG